MHELLDDAHGLLADVAQLRHAIHREPELGLNLPLTQARVLDALQGLPLEIRRGTGITSVVADLRGGQPGPTIILRGDMDALPLHEDNDVPFKSSIDGRMHACGHDAHTAMLVGAARLLTRRQQTLHGTVRFMFQPGQESYAGAVVMLDEGLLDAPSGGMALQTLVTRSVNVFSPAVLTIGKIEAGTASNIIPEIATLQGTIRTLSPTTRATLVEGLRRVAHGVCAAHGLEADVTNHAGYPVTVNDADFARFVLETGPRPPRRRAFDRAANAPTGSRGLRVRARADSGRDGLARDATLRLCRG